MSSSQVAIIGAGMTGITAARSLNNAGYTVQLFEKSRGSGGRLASKRSAMGRVNLGAQAFHADQAEFLAELDHWQHAGWLKQTQQQWTGIPYMSALTRNLLGELNTLFSCEIRQLSHTQQGWLLLDQHGQQHGPFAQLIVAIPAPQASTLLSNCAPDLAACAASVVMQPTWMVALGFKEPLTASQPLSPMQQRIIAEVRPSAIAAEQPMQTWLLRASVAWSIEHLEDEPAQVIHRLSNCFAELFDTAPPEADNAFAHRWRYALGALEQPLNTLTDLSRGLVVAGDWCGQGDLQSAWCSGQHAAQQLINSWGITG